MLYKEKEFTPTHYRLRLKDGRDVLGQLWENGKRFILVGTSEADAEVIPYAGCGAYAVDAVMESTEVKRIKIVRTEDPVITELKSRLDKLEKNPDK